jgi:hypothetical protein
MPWDGSGNFTRTNGDKTGAAAWQEDANDSIDVEADRHDTHDQDLADGVAACLTKNSETEPTSFVTWIPKNWNAGTAGGTANALTLSLTPAPASYNTGMMIVFQANVNTTGAATINLNGLGAKDVKQRTGADTVANSLVGAAHYIAFYNGTDFILLDEITSGAQTFAGKKTFSGGVVGDGSELTDLNATELKSGTVPSGRLSGSYTSITGVGALGAGSITSGFGNINIGSSTFTGNGSGLTSLNASNVSSGTLNNGRLPAVISQTRFAASGAGEGGFRAEVSDTQPGFLANTAGTSAVIAANFNNGNGTVGSIQFSGSSTTFNTSSARWLKENIEPAKSGWELLKQFQVREFDWKADKKHQAFGWIADEVAEVLPEAVPEAKDSVDNSKPVPLVVRVLQEAMERIEKLEGQSG